MKRKSEQASELDSDKKDTGIVRLEILNNYDQYAKGISNGKSGHHAEIDGQCKQRDRNSKKENARNQKPCNRNEDCL